MRLLEYTVLVMGIIVCVSAGLNDVVPDKECFGTNNGLSYSQSYIRHYRSMKRRYKECTHINGNLEITHLANNDYNYDMSFLNNIRYVTGYVLIALNTGVNVLRFPSLQIIRGNNTMRLRGKEYSLAVALNYKSNYPKLGLIELHFPQLKEISGGDILFTQNPRLCYIDTINWQAISGRGSDSIDAPGTDPVSPFNRKCAECPVECKVNGRSRCWGNDENLCQRAPPNVCHSSCPYRCYGPGPEGCCHGNCAGGCWGPKSTECMLCKDYRLWNRCVESCPLEYDHLNQMCYIQNILS
ncbi:hypothetical protein LOTGIDRAFT_238156 [Lottia gigantea]|uniref:receptor protein-tyrosine kinase n=1 Tax=Lottia gigantea TaxID=225164 RepID=V4CHY6_LOTGI|nr:hypothetical protein LOTGIDRAFT_238156 [Lottia gigantea]ESP01755.1 hypothetical protein LOTGIDRAFT_238156 [Lottia gigantea]